MQWEVEPTGARIAQLATDLTARIDALDPESDTPVYSDFTFSIAVADWTLANGVYTARVNNTVLLTENAGIQVFYDASLRTGLTGDIFADKYTGYVIFTTTLQPVGPISGIIRVLDSVSGMLSVAKGGTGAATPKKARENLNTPIRDISVDFGTVSSLPQTIYDADITANMVAFDAAFGNPAAVPNGIDVTFAAGSVTISGTMVSGQETTISFLCHEKRTAVEGTESESAEPRVNEFVHVGAQTLTADQQTQVRANLGAASASDVATLNSNLSNNVFQEIAPTGTRCTVVSGGVAVVGNLAVINVKIHSAYSATNTPSMLSVNVGTPKCVTALSCVKSGTTQGSMSGAIACHIGTNRQVYIQSVENDAYYDISGVMVLA